MVSARGVSARKGGVSARGGVHLPPVNRITDRCKNIIFPQLRLRTVICPYSMTQDNTQSGLQTFLDNH